MTYTEIIKSFRKDIDLIELINRQQEEIDNLTYTLWGVMHFVDKWLDGDELKQDEVNRADTMRKKTLQIIEEKQAEIERLKGWENLLKAESPAPIKAKARAEAIKEFAERLKMNITINNTNDGYLDYSVDYHCLMEDIDDLVNEMVDEEE